MSDGKIYQAIPACMADIEAIAKDRKNTSQGYQFRGIDDVYNELHAILAKHGVFTVPEVLEERSEERQTAKGGVLIYRILRIRYTFFAADGSSVTAVVVGEGMDSGDKASNKAMSVGHKYALLQVFAIPTEEAKDPENDSPQPLPRAKAPAQPPNRLPADWEKQIAACAQTRILLPLVKSWGDVGADVHEAANARMATLAVAAIQQAATVDALDAMAKYCSEGPMAERLVDWRLTVDQAISDRRAAIDKEKTA